LFTLPGKVILVALAIGAGYLSTSNANRNAKGSWTSTSDDRNRRRQPQADRAYKAALHQFEKIAGAFAIAPDDT